MVVSILLRNIFAESAFLFNRVVFETDVSRIRYKHICILGSTLTLYPYQIAIMQSGDYSLTLEDVDEFVYGTDDNEE